MGLVRSKLGEYKRANEDFNKAIKLYKFEKEKVLEIYYCRYNLGINFRHMKRYEESVAELRFALDLMPEKASCLNNMGLTLFEKGEFDSAADHFKKAIKFGPSAVHYNNRGLANFHAQNIKDALEDFDRALELNSNSDPTIYFNRGNALLSQNQYERALMDYEEAITIQPNNPKYFHAKGIAYEAMAGEIETKHGKKRKFDKSSRDEEQADSLKVYLRFDYLELVEESIKSYLQAIDVDENFLQSRFHLGKMLAATYQYQEALHHYNRVIESLKPSENDPEE
jgi:tetratricopeptide (TPR) repeat protein